MRPGPKYTSDITETTVYSYGTHLFNQDMASCLFIRPSVIYDREGWYFSDYQILVNKAVSLQSQFPVIFGKFFHAKP